MKNKTRELVLAAILTALAIIITFFPKIDFGGFFTLTPGSHVPTFLAMFVSPWVAVMSVIGSCIGFFFSTSSLLVVTRAALHLVFVLVGMKMIDKKINIFLVIILTAVLHSVAEGVAVYALTPILVKNSEATMLAAGWTALSVTFVHHLIDAAITTPILYALTKAKLVARPDFMK